MGVMLTIKRSDGGRLTIAEAKRLILEASPREKFVDIFLLPSGTLKAVRDDEPKSIYAAHLDQDFTANCERLGIVPRWKYRPGLTAYASSTGADFLYTIDHDEFVRLAKLFDLAVEVVPEPIDAAPPRPLQRQHSQEAAILAKLIELGYSPEELPVPPSGKPSTAKQDVKAALRFSADIMNKAWQRLRADGRIKDA